jgi:ABC-2 type transport system permease protein
MTTVPTRLPSRAYALLTWTEAKLVARDVGGLVTPLLLPMLIMVMNGLGSDGAPEPRLGGLPVLDAYIVPSTLVMVVALIGVVNMPAALAAYRKYGVLRRLAVTPAHPVLVLAAQLVVSLVQALIGMLLALVVARLAFDVALPRNLGGAIGVFFLVVAAMYALGLLLAATSPSPGAALAFGLIAFFGTMALGGGFGSRDNLPDWLAVIGEHLPYGASFDALRATWIGTPPDVAHIAVLAGITVLATAAAAKLFRWN